MCDDGVGGTGDGMSIVVEVELGDALEPELVLGRRDSGKEFLRALGRAAASLSTIKSGCVSRGAAVIASNISHERQKAGSAALRHAGMRPRPGSV
jgi:hypothetical protein